jgi:transcriptional antiterminator RfaH
MGTDTLNSGQPKTSGIAWTRPSIEEYFKIKFPGLFIVAATCVSVTATDEVPSERKYRRRCCFRRFDTMDTRCVDSQCSVVERALASERSQVRFSQIPRNSAMDALRELQMEDMLHWYLIHTKPAREAVAEVNLLRQGYEVYYPRLLRPTRHRGRWTDRVASLFPRYLFLRLAVGRQAMGPVRSTVGVANIVRFGYDYTVVPDAVIANLRMRADSETGLHRLQGRAPIMPGSNVRVVGGVFDGLEGVFQRESGVERVVLLLGLLGRDTFVQLPAALILPRLDSQAKLVLQ